MIAESGSWSLGVLIGVPVTILLVLVCLGVIALGALNWDDDGVIAVVLGGVVLVAVVGFALSPLGFYPYKAEYHQWREVSGEVVDIDKRLVSSGESGMEEKFVVRFDGSSQEFRVDDTRAALVEPGDQLTVACKRQWEYAATAGYVCRWIGSEAE